MGMTSNLPVALAPACEWYACYIILWIVLFWLFDVMATNTKYPLSFLDVRFSGLERRGAASVSILLSRQFGLKVFSSLIVSRSLRALAFGRVAVSWDGDRRFCTHYSRKSHKRFEWSQQTNCSCTTPRRRWSGFVHYLAFAADAIAFMFGSRLRNASHKLR